MQRKPLKKAIMKSSNLEKVYFNKKTSALLKKINKQKNYCNRFYVDLTNVCKNKTLWKYFQSYCSDKRKIAKKITLADGLVSEELNQFFENVRKRF